MDATLTNYFGFLPGEPFAGVAVELPSAAVATIVKRST
jgi:hypothetical protein